MHGSVGYVLAGMTVVAGLGVAGLNLVYQLRGLAGGLQQVVVPGDHDIALAEAGVHTIFHEQRAVVSGRYFAGDRTLNGVSLRLHPATGGPEIPIQSTSMSTSYELPDRAGSSIATFRIGEPGLYRLSARYSESAAATTAVLAIGKGVERRMLMATFGSVGMALAGVFAGAAVAVITWVGGRRRAEKRAEMEPERRAV